MMNNPPDLFAQPPVRSYYVRKGPQKRRFNRKALAVLGVLSAVLLGTGAYFLGSYHSVGTGEIPTIQAALPIKQKPDQPGGIDIPHQDMTVFQQLDKHEEEEKTPVEHILPAAKAPEAIVTQTTASALPDQVTGGAQGEAVGAEGTQVPPASALPSASSSTHGGSGKIESLTPPSALDTTKVFKEAAPQSGVAPADAVSATSPLSATPPELTTASTPSSAAEQPVPQPPDAHKTAAVTVATPHVPKTAPVGVSAPPVNHAANLQNDKAAKTATSMAASSSEISKPTTKTSASKAKPVGRSESLPASLFTGDPSQQIQKLEQKEKAETSNASHSVASSGSYAVQFASIPNEATAKAEMQKLQGRFSNLLGGKSLRLVRATIAGKGTYYRVQTTNNLSESSARSLCASVKTAGGSCLLAKAH